MSDKVCRVYGVEVSRREFRRELICIFLDSIAVAVLVGLALTLDIHSAFKLALLAALAGYSYTSYWCSRETFRLRSGEGQR